MPCDCHVENVENGVPESHFVTISKIKLVKLSLLSRSISNLNEIYQYQFKTILDKLVFNKKF